jgi:glycosyltransferase involved in cell wall biosynthesis
MRIAMISTVYKATPPAGYGGIERIVHTLVEQLVRDGHDVTLFAAPGSHCSGKTVEVQGYDPLNAPSGMNKASEVLSEERLYEVMESYLHDHPVDVIHDWSFQNLFVLRHPELFPFIISTCIPPLLDYRRQNLVAASHAHAVLCGGNTQYVHYGIDTDRWEYCYTKKSYFIHVAKIARYKAQHIAILAARKARKDLVIAGPVENGLYFRYIIKPLLWISPHVSYIGEIADAGVYLRDAAALIQTPRWFDTFPFAILEANASGTPVISLADGGVPEQISNGVNGFLCKTFNDLVEAMERVHEIKPQDCRAYAEEHFSVKRMAREYQKLYQLVVDGETW